MTDHFQLHIFIKKLLILKWIRAKEARLLREQHVSEDPARKHLVLSEEAEAVPEESEHFEADIHSMQKELRLNPARPCANAEANTSCVSEGECSVTSVLLIIPCLLSKLNSGGVMMKKWTTLDWMKKLVVLILIFLNCWFLLKLFPYILHGFNYIIGILTPFLIGCLIAYLLHPLIEGLHKQGMPRPVAILVIYLLFFGTVIVGCIKGAPIVVEELKSFARQGPHLQEMYEDNVNHIYNATSDFPETLHDHFDRMLASLENGLSQLVERIILWIQGLFKSIFTILLIPFIVFYLLKDFTGVKNWLSRNISSRVRESGRAFVREIDASLGSYIRGQLFVCLVVAVVSIIGLWILRMPYALLLGIFIGMTDIIPYFGPVIGAVPALLVAVTLSMKKVMFVLLLILIVQFLEGNIFSPLIVGKSVHIHPIFIMLALVIGGDISGVVGMLIAIPIFVTLRVFVIHFIKYRKKIDNEQGTRL